MNKYFVYVGTYTMGSSEGIYICDFDGKTGNLTIKHTVKAENPSFLAIDRNHQFLYAVNETNHFCGKPGGGVSAYSIQRDSGNIVLLNQSSTIGAGPCYVEIDQGGKYLLITNYQGGSIVVIALQEDGTLGEITDYIKYEGGSINRQRQENSHPHSINVDHANRYVFIPDLGSDRIRSYRLDPENGKLIANSKSWYEVMPGAGPRHWTFDIQGKFAYLINELNSTVITYAYDCQRGWLEERQSITTLPEDFKGENISADLHLHPSGKFLYGSNRGHDSIVIYRVHPRTGLLSLIGHQSTYGKNPRNFCIDPSGDFLLVANQASDGIVVFRIQQDTGLLMQSGEPVKVPEPVCLKMIPVTQ